MRSLSTIFSLTLQSKEERIVMKRIILLVIVSLLLFASCGRMPQPTAQEIVEAVKASQQQNGEYVSADEEMIKILFDFEPSDYSDWAVEYSKEAACADVIIVFKSGDKDTQSKTQDFLKEFLERRLNDFKGYAPEEAKKLEESRLLTYGNYDILTICGDFRSAKDAADRLFK